MTQARANVDQLVVADQGVLNLLGFTVAEVTEGSVVMQMVVTQKLVNSQGFCHGGVLFSLADTTAAYVCGSLGVHSATIDAQIKYFTPASVDSIVKAHGKVTMPHSKIIHVDVQLRADDDQMYAQYQGTFYNRGSLQK